MREFKELGINQPDYRKYAEIKELSPGWLQLLQGMDCLKFAITGIVVIAIAAFYKNHEAVVLTTIASVAIAGIVLALGVAHVQRSVRNGETFTNPTKSSLESRNDRGNKGKSRTA